MAISAANRRIPATTKQKQNVVQLVLPAGDEKDQYTKQELLTELHIAASTFDRYKNHLADKGITFPEWISTGGGAGKGRPIVYPLDIKNLFVEMVEHIKLGKNPEEAAAHTAKKHIAETAPIKTQVTIDHLPNVIQESDKPLLKDLSPKFKFGDIVEGTVSSIESYGAFVNDGLYMRGLIHVSNIKDGIVTDVGKYFTVGQRIKAKVTAVKPDGRLSLSTRCFTQAELKAMGQTSLVNEAVESHPALEKLGELKAKLELETPPIEAPKPAAPNPATSPPLMKEVQTILKGKIGAISSAAENKFMELFEKHGTVAFLMQLGVVSASFDVDLGLLLARELEQKLQCL